MKQFFVLMLVLLSGCSSFYPRPETPRPPQSLPSTITRHLIAPESFQFILLEVNKISETWKVVGDGFNLKFNYIHRPSRNPKDLIILFNILKDKHQTVSGWIANNLVAAGYSCLIIEQEDFLSRKKLRHILPRDNEELCDWNTYFGRNLQYLSLIIRHWIPDQEELSGRYSFVGVSMGGILCVGAAACFPEAQVSIAIMAGGDNYQVLSESKENLVVREFAGLITAYREDSGCTIEEAKTQIEYDLAHLDFRVLEMARCVDTMKVRQIISLYDSSVPTVTQWNLHNALGSPEMRAYPSGHVSLGLFGWSVRDQIISWIQQANPPLNRPHPHQ